MLRMTGKHKAIVWCKYIYVDDDDTTVEWMACAGDKFCQAIYYNWGSALVATKHFSR